MEVLQWQRQHTTTIMTPGRRTGRGPGRAGPGRVPGPDLHPGNAGPPRLAAPAAPRPPRPGCRPAGSSPPCYWDIESGGLDLEAPLPGRAPTGQFTDAGHPPRRRHGRPARRGRRPGPEIRRGHLRGHRTVRPRHLQRAETGKETVPQRHPAVRHRRARRHRRRQRHHRPGPADEARRRGMVPAPAEGENLERARRAFPGRLEHRPRPLRVPRRPDPAPGPGQGQPGPHQDPPRPGPRPRPGRGADLHLADRGQARHAHHRRPAQRRPGPLPRPRPGTGGPPRPCTRILRNPKYTGHMVYGRHPQPQRPPRPRPPGPVAVVPRARPPRHRGPGHLGRRPAHRRRARHQPRRRPA